MMRIVIDLGGTNVRIGKVSDNQIVTQKSVPCPAKESEKVVLDLIKSLICEMMSPEVDGIGIGVPSVVDAEKGIVYDVINIPSWKEVHLKEILEKQFGIPVHVDNDVNCFVLGEKFFGAAQPFDNVVGITLGTGVGAGIVIDGNLYRGANTGAGEVGSLPYLESDYEHYCSSIFLQRCFNITGKELSQKAANGDEQALNVWRQFGFHLGKLLQVLLFTYDPEAIIIGGGIAAASTYFSEAMKQSMAQDFPYSHTINKIHICFSSLAGCNMLGASKL